MGDSSENHSVCFRLSIFYTIYFPFSSFWHAFWHACATMCHDLYANLEKVTNVSLADEISQRRRKVKLLFLKWYYIMVLCENCQNRNVLIINAFKIIDTRIDN